MAVQFLEPMDHVLVVFYTPPLRCIQKQYTLRVWRECEEDAPPWEWRSQYPQLYNLALLSRYSSTNSIALHFTALVTLFSLKILHI